MFSITVPIQYTYYELPLREGSTQQLRNLREKCKPRFCYYSSLKSPIFQIPMLVSKTINVNAVLLQMKYFR